MFRWELGLVTTRAGEVTLPGEPLERGFREQREEDEEIVTNLADVDEMSVMRKWIGTRNRGWA